MKHLNIILFGSKITPQLFFVLISVIFFIYFIHFFFILVQFDPTKRDINAGYNHIIMRE